MFAGGEVVGIVGGVVFVGVGGVVDSIVVGVVFVFVRVRGFVTLAILVCCCCCCCCCFCLRVIAAEGHWQTFSSTRYICTPTNSPDFVVGGCL